MNDMVERARAAVEEELHTVLALCQLQAEVKKLRAEVSDLKSGEQNRVQIATPPLSDEQATAELPSNAEIVKLRAELAEARSFIRSTYDQFEKHHPYAHELRTSYPWLEDAVANAELLKLAEQQAEIERLEEREGGLRDAAMCPPDCDLLTWVRMLGDEWHKQMAAEAGGTLCDLFTRIDAHIAASRHLPHSGQPLTLLLDCKAKIERLTAELDVACGYLTDRAKDYLWGWNALRNVHGYYSVEGVWLGENFRDVIHWKAAGAGRDGS
jgi:hypothetical protein